MTQRDQHLQLSDEQARILHAANRGGLKSNEHGRWL